MVILTFLRAAVVSEETQSTVVDQFSEAVMFREPQQLSLFPLLLHPPRFDGQRRFGGDYDGYRGGPRGPSGDFGDKGGAPGDYRPSFGAKDLESRHQKSEIPLTSGDIPVGIKRYILTFGFEDLDEFPSSMSRKENLISELHPRKGTWKIAVRITDMWDVKKHNGRQAIDMGVKIEATLWQELFPEFQPKLALGCSYLIQNIKVVDNQSEYKVSPISYLLYFVKTTSVKEVERPEILANVHVITEIADIISGIAP
ncbi:hypothetical protein JHK82_044434 [Glycine max]|nr:hypothetical protein JHK86_044783 [Glycine max]KAG4951532.1 hypothetical protein JHK85_045399 [Glycine max]KAG5099382.1 hypothetical protein JHK82_044434 [Glycine max]KAG5107986.1 hypothetical protein JHK84_044893 [Glycine max]